MIELVNVSKFYNNNGVVSQGLSNINIKLNKNEIVAITGESGSGKSTLLNVITKVDTFDEGEIFVNGEETSYFDINDMDLFRKDKVGFIFQTYNIIDSYTVLENVMAPLLINGYKDKDARQKAIELIKKVGLYRQMKHRGSNLSGGEKQRCVIARALASDVEILACDEPTGNLDSKTGAEIINLIKEISKDKLVLIVTHNFDEVKDIVTRKILVQDGKIAEDVVLKKSENDDEVKEMNLEVKPLPRGLAFKFAKKNLIFTPRRTILLSLVMLFISAFTLILYQNIMKAADEEYIENDYNYIGDNKVVIYQKEYGKLDKDLIEQNFKDFTIEYNQFYALSNGIYCEYTDSYNSPYTAYSTYTSYESNPTDYTLKYGSEPKEDNEVLMLFPKDTYRSITSFINSYVHLQNRQYNVSFKITGVGVSDNVKDMTLAKNKKIENYYHNACLLSNAYCTNSKGISYSITVLPTNKPSYFSCQYLNLDAKTITVFNPAYIFNFPDVENVEEYTSPIFYLNPSDRFFEDDIYEVSVYGNAKKIKKIANQLDLKYLEPSTLTTANKLQEFINELTKYLSIILSSSTLIIIFFITYVILKVIYESKRKDYNIFRTLGVTKRGMSKIVKNEVMIITIIISTITLIACALIGRHPKVILLNDIKPMVVVLYYVAVIFMGLLLQRRLNRRLFKFSVQQVFKQEVSHND